MQRPVPCSPMYSSNNIMGGGLSNEDTGEGDAPRTVGEFNSPIWMEFYSYWVDRNDENQDAIISSSSSNPFSPFGRDVLTSHCHSSPPVSWINGMPMPGVSVSRQEWLETKISTTTATTVVALNPTDDLEALFQDVESPKPRRTFYDYDDDSIQNFLQCEDVLDFLNDSPAVATDHYLMSSACLVNLTNQESVGTAGLTEKKKVKKKVKKKNVKWAIHDDSRCSSRGRPIKPSSKKKKFKKHL